MRRYTISGALVYNDAYKERERFTQRDLSVSRGRILESVPRETRKIDLTGYAVFPALINAHDHLELNHYPRTKFREKYDNAHQWGEDVNEHLNDSLFRRLRAYPLWDRLFIGGLKNLLCGALTVAHHNPPHRELFSSDYPVRVLRRYGWAHSLHFNTDAEVVKAYKRTPADVPFFIHLGEGTDEIAKAELGRFVGLGCFGKNTVLVHGVGLSEVEYAGQWKGHETLRLVTCPSTNLYLLGETVYQRIPAMLALTAIGSDSRLTADGDLLDELRCAQACFRFVESDYVMFGMVTSAPAKIMGIQQDRGHLKPGAFADYLVMAGQRETLHSLVQARRADIALVVRGGTPQIGDPELMARFPDVPTVPATLDGRPKAIHANLAKQIKRCKLQEPGLTVE